MFIYSYNKLKIMFINMKGDLIMCNQGCQDCQPLIDKAPNSDPNVSGFQIELISCEMITPTNREFIYEITPVGTPPNSISNILICLCPESFVECEVTVPDPDPENPPTCFFETNPNAGGNPVKCQGVKYENLGENNDPDSLITVSLTVKDEEITVEPIQIGYKAATPSYIWTVCGPSCGTENRIRGIKF